MILNTAEDLHLDQKLEHFMDIEIQRFWGNCEYLMRSSV